VPSAGSLEREAFSRAETRHEAHRHGAIHWNTTIERLRGNDQTNEDLRAGVQNESRSSKLISVETTTIVNGSNGFFALLFRAHRFVKGSIYCSLFP